MVCAAISSLIFLGAFTILGSMTGSWDRSTSQTTANGDAAKVMQRLIADLREAKSFTIQDPGPTSGSRLVITYPLQNPDGSYDAYVANPDTDEQVTYYVQNRTLWRLKPSESADPIAVCRGTNDELSAGENELVPSTWTNESGVEALQFESDSPRSVTITVRTRMRQRIPTPDPETGEPTRAPIISELTERVFLSRNR
jgi:type II secretory pathway component PulJ